MGDCGHCSKFVTMQLFHELKQQFPTLPDHIVSQCIVQSNHDRETCARRLRARQDSRPPPGAFPPPAPQPEDDNEVASAAVAAVLYLSEYPPLRLAMSEQQQRQSQQQQFAEAASKLRPLPLLDIDTRSAAVQTSSRESSAASTSTFSPFCDAANPASFALSVNVNCSPIVEACDLLTTCEPSQSDYQPILIPTDPTTRSVTSVSLTLRSPSSEASQQPQQQQPSPSIDISSQGPSSLTYSSSVDPRAGGGYQSHLQISIARNKRPRLPQSQRPSSLSALVHDSGAQSSRPPGLPAAPTTSQLPHPTSTMSAPTTPSGPAQNIALPSSSLPTTPVSGPSTSLGAIPRIPRANNSESSSEYPTEYQGILADVPDELKPLVTKQLISRDRLAALVAIEKETLKALEQEVELLNQEIPPEEYERQLHSEIYHLQLECDKLAEEVDRTSGSRVPLGETSAQFYQNIYTGQQFVPTTSSIIPPPLPSQPPTWEPQPSRTDNQDEAEGPPWFCTKCTFANHPLMQKCEECDTPRVTQSREGETQDIHIRVTRHQKLPPRRTLNNWVI